MTPARAAHDATLATDGPERGSPRPVGAAERLPWLDVLRGFALAGVLLANLPLFAGDPYLSEAQRRALPTAALDAPVRQAVELLVDNKFMGLFAILFGVGCSLQLAAARARGGDALRLLRRRLVWLLVIGCAHGWLAWTWDILRFYALWGLLLPLCDRLRPRALLVASVAFGVAVPAAWRGVAAAIGTAGYGARASEVGQRALAAFAGGGYFEVVRANWEWDWLITASPTQGAYQATVFGRMLLGLWLARWLTGGHLAARRAALRRLALVALPVGLAGSAVFAGLVEPPAGPFWRPLFAETGALALTLGYLALVLLAAGTPAGARLLAPLAAVGRMSFTSYLLQTAFGLWLFYGFLPGPGLIGEVGMAALLPLWAAVFAAQVAFSGVWLRHFAFGPAEWLWRSLTYRRRQPWRAPAAGTAAPAPAVARPT